MNAHVPRDETLWTSDYWLRHCEGYAVDGPDGHIGFVSEVVESDDSFDLIVFVAVGELRIPSIAIVDVDLDGERIAVAECPARARRPADGIGVSPRIGSGRSLMASSPPGTTMAS